MCKQNLLCIIYQKLYHKQNFLFLFLVKESLIVTGASQVSAAYRTFSYHTEFQRAELKKLIMIIALADFAIPKLDELPEQWQLYKHLFLPHKIKICSASYLQQIVDKITKKITKIKKCNQNNLLECNKSLKEFGYRKTHAKHTKRVKIEVVAIRRYHKCRSVSMYRPAKSTINLIKTDLNCIELSSAKERVSRAAESPGLVGDSQQVQLSTGVNSDNKKTQTIQLLI